MKLLMTPLLFLVVASKLQCICGGSVTSFMSVLEVGEKAQQEDDCHRRRVSCRNNYDERMPSWRKEIFPFVTFYHWGTYLTSLNTSFDLFHIEVAVSNDYFKEGGQVAMLEEIPSTLIASGVKARVLAGKSFNQSASYLCSSSWGYSYHVVDFEIYPHSEVALNIPENLETVFLYVYDGTLQELNRGEMNMIEEETAVVFNAEKSPPNARVIEMRTGNKGARVMLLGAGPKPYQNGAVEKEEESDQVFLDDVYSGDFNETSIEMTPKPNYPILFNSIHDYTNTDEIKLASLGPACIDGSENIYSTEA